MKLDDPAWMSAEELQAWRPPLAALKRLAGLHVAGSLAGLERPTIAIVGTRAPSEAGRRLARRTAEELGQAGLCIVSGLAHGIDGAAHAGALAAGAPTIGVLGGGHRCFFPRGNRALAERILESGGAVVSPFAPDDAARPPQFLQRNAIIAALADAVAVVEAAARSGSLNTAGWAANLGLPVFAFPGEVDRPKAAGCLALIRDGATLVRDAGDILEGMGLPRRPAAGPAEEPPSELAPLGKALWAALRDGPLSLDRLIEASGATPAAALAELVRLELAGYIVRNGEGFTRNA
jgi:DNA processing protein